MDKHSSTKVKDHAFVFSPMAIQFVCGHPNQDICGVSPKWRHNVGSHYTLLSNMSFWGITLQFSLTGTKGSKHFPAWKMLLSTKWKCWKWFVKDKVEELKWSKQSPDLHFDYCSFGWMHKFRHTLQNLVEINLELSIQKVWTTSLGVHKQVHLCRIVLMFSITNKMFMMSLWWVFVK